MTAHPRQAATVIVLRGGAESLEVLLARRNPAARFMGDLWVFPGGAVDPSDGDGDAGHRAAALREVEEEAGLTLPGPDALLPFSRWITPRLLPIRFDTRFYVAAAPAGQEPRADGSEMVEIGWYAPAAALARLRLPFPTRAHLEELAGFASADAVLAAAPGRAIVPIEPDVRDLPPDAIP